MSTKTYSVTFSIKWDVTITWVEAVSPGEAVDKAQEILYTPDIDNIEIIDYSLDKNY